MPSAPLPFATGPALRFGNQAQFHPRRYLRGLVDALASDGSVVFERTRVLSVEDGEPCRVETERGTVTANAVVVASHVPVVNKVFLHTKLEPMRSYLLALSTGQPHPDGLFWDLATPYHYWRSVRIDGQDLMLVGGDDHKVGETEDTEGAFRELEAYVRQRLGRAGRQRPLVGPDHRTGGRAGLRGAQLDVHPRVRGHRLLGQRADRGHRRGDDPVRTRSGDRRTPGVTCSPPPG